MKIVLEVPEDFNAIGFTMIHGADAGNLSFRIANGVITYEDVKDGKEIKLPNEG